MQSIGRARFIFHMAIYLLLILFSLVIYKSYEGNQITLFQNVSVYHLFPMLIFIISYIFFLYSFSKRLSDVSLNVKIIATFMFLFGIITWMVFLNDPSSYLETPNINVFFIVGYLFHPFFPIVPVLILSFIRGKKTEDFIYKLISHNLYGGLFFTKKLKEKILTRNGIEKYLFFISIIFFFITYPIIFSENIRINDNVYNYKTSQSDNIINREDYIGTYQTIIEDSENLSYPLDIRLKIFSSDGKNYYLGINHTYEKYFKFYGKLKIIDKNTMKFDNPSMDYKGQRCLLGLKFSANKVFVKQLNDINQLASMETKPNINKSWFENNKLPYSDDDLYGYCFAGGPILPIYGAYNKISSENPKTLEVGRNQGIKSFEEVFNINSSNYVVPKTGKHIKDGLKMEIYVYLILSFLFILFLIKISPNFVYFMFIPLSILFSYIKRLFSKMEDIEDSMKK